MGCGICSTGGCTPAGCKSNGSCLTNGCSKLDVYDWLSQMDMPVNYKPFSIIEIKFKGSRKEFYQNPDNVYLENGDLVVVEAATGGYDIGHVSVTGELVRMQMVKRRVKEEDVLKKIYRRATPSDVDKWKAAKDLEWETMHSARKLAVALNLSMKLSDVDYQADKTKATFYYTAEGRVDFRELIKKMAETFRIRIEMRQIGMRQEAGRLGGIGSCGRELCCSTWLTNFKTVSTAAARYQNLSLNTLKLAGQCGKLKCCLNYELDTYLDALKDIPDRIDSLQTEIGVARHQKTDIFKKIMWFAYPNTEDWIPLKVDRVKEIMAMNKRGQKPVNLKEEALELTPVTVVEKTPDYENVVGQDSLTRLDDKNRSRNKSNRNKGGNNENRNNAGRPEKGNRTQGQPQTRPAGQPQAKQGQPGAKPVQPGGQPRQGQPKQSQPKQGGQPGGQPGQPRQNQPPRQNPPVAASGEITEGATPAQAEGQAGGQPSANRNRNKNRRKKNKDKPKDE